MPRYLTPPRIALLALVHLYLQDAVPLDAALDVLAFVASHLDHPLSDPPDRWLQTENALDLAASVAEFEHLLSFSLGLPAPLWDLFLACLWDLDSLDALHGFVDAKSALLAASPADLGLTDSPPAPPRLAPNSPLGCFVRRCQLEFARLPLHDAAELWTAFVRYRQPTAAYWRRRHPGCLALDSVLADEPAWAVLAEVAYDDGPEPARMPATDDVEQLLEFQIAQMQKYGTRVPLQTKARFQELLRESHLIPSLSHYLSFLDAWKSGDYTSSLDYLHRYFDYQSRHSDSMHRERQFYHYALLNLAALHADFACFHDALAAMLETVTTARENHDSACLNFALNWLFHFARAHPLATGTAGCDDLPSSLAFLRVQARESGMPMLWSSVLLTEARVLLLAGDSVAAALENVVRASHVLVDRNLSVGPHMSVAIAVWDRLGVAALSAMTCDVFLRCHAKRSTLDDELRVVCRLAAMLVGRGRYHDAFALLEDVDPDSLRGDYKAKQYWLKTRGLLKLTRDLHRGHLASADRLLAQLLQSRTQDLEPDLASAIDTLHVEALVRRGDLPAALHRVEEMLGGGGSPDESGTGSPDIYVHTRLLLAKAHLLSVAGRPQRGLALALRAASLAWRARLMPLVWQAAGAVANVLTSLAEFAAAADLLVAAIPRCLELDLDAVAAALYAHLADAYVGMAGQTPTKPGDSPAGNSPTDHGSNPDPGNPTGNNPTGNSPTGNSTTGNSPTTDSRARLLALAVDALDSAAAHYAAVEDVDRQCEMLAKAATVLGGDDAEAYAERYMAVRRKRPG